MKPTSSTSAKVPKATQSLCSAPASKYHPLINANKFANAPKAEPTKPLLNPQVMQEIKSFQTNNRDTSIKVSRINKRACMIVMHMEWIGHSHTIEITYPKEYPTVKKGFTCRELRTGQIPILSFIPKVNQQFVGKSLNIEKVLRYLATTFANFKEKNNTTVTATATPTPTPVPAPPSASTPIIASTPVRPVKPINTNDLLRKQHETITSDIMIINEILKTASSKEDTHAMYVTISDSESETDDRPETDSAPDVDIEVVRSVPTAGCDYNEFVEKMANDLQADNPSIDEDTLMDIIQLCWKNADDPEKIRKILEGSDSETDTDTDFDTDTSSDTSATTYLTNSDRSDDHLTSSDEYVLDNTVKECIKTILGADTEVEDNQDVIEESASTENPNTVPESLNDNIESQVEPVGNDIIESQVESVGDDIIESQAESVGDDIIESQVEPFVESVGNNDIESQAKTLGNSVVEPQVDDNVEFQAAPLEDPVVEDSTEILIEAQSIPTAPAVIQTQTVSEVAIESPTEISQDDMIDTLDDDMQDDFPKYVMSPIIMKAVPPKKYVSTDEDIPIKSSYKPSKKGPAKKVAKSAKPVIAKAVPVTTPSVSLSVVAPQQINYADVKDNIGLYLDLSQYAGSERLPFDKEKLLANAAKYQEEMDFGSNSKISKSFGSTGAIRVVYNEFYSLYQLGQRRNFKVIPVNDNLYHLRIEFNKKFFDPKSNLYQDMRLYDRPVIIEVQIDGKLYPFYPPKLCLISPRLENHLNARIATMELLLLSNWNPIYNIETIIGYFRELMNMHGQIDQSTELDAYSDLENELIELSLLTEVPCRVNAFLTIEQLKDIKANVQTVGSKSTRDTCWKAGTGYGFDGQEKWDLNATMKAKAHRDMQLVRCIKAITRYLTKIIIGTSNVTESDAVQILLNSCYIPYMKSIFYGNNILELLKNCELFDALLTVCRILPKTFIEIFCIVDTDSKALFEIFDEISLDCEMYLTTIKNATAAPKKTKSAPKKKYIPDPESDYDSDFGGMDMKTATATDPNLELNIVSNFVSFNKCLQKRVSAHKEAMAAPVAVTTTVPVPSVLREIYKIELQKEACKESNKMDMNAFDKLIRQSHESKDTEFVTNKSISTIAKEIMSHRKNMPIDLASSIFYRFNPDNLKYHEFMIAGPADTPYDSGCFLFRMYCPSNYPNTNPKVNIYTTGAGSVRFGPNLYADGKVCLSILGTWSGQAGENWLPGTSTMMQIMISIQSLVMIPEPYYNEPGYERQYKSAHAQNQSSSYNQRIRFECMKWAMLDSLQNPPENFAEAVRLHFKLKAQYVRELCARWLAECNAKYKAEFQSTYDKLLIELNKL